MLSFIHVLSVCLSSPVTPPSSSLPPMLATPSSSPTTGIEIPGDMGGLDTGAIAGIVLALIFLVLVITVLVAIILVYLRHRTVTKSYEFDVSRGLFTFVCDESLYLYLSLSL